MEVTAIAVALGLITGVLAGGSPGRLLDTPLRLMVLGVAALALRFVLALWLPGDGWPEPGALAIHGGALALALAFCVANIRLRGMPVVVVGLAANALAVALNGGMPLAAEARPGPAEEAVAAIERSPLHVPEVGATVGVLGQVIPVPEPVDRHVSFGDLIFAAGLADVLFHASRRRPGRREPSRPVAAKPRAPVAAAVAGTVERLPAAELPAAELPAERGAREPVGGTAGVGQPSAARGERGTVSDDPGERDEHPPVTTPLR